MLIPGRAIALVVRLPLLTLAFAVGHFMLAYASAWLMYPFSSRFHLLSSVFHGLFKGLGIPSLIRRSILAEALSLDLLTRPEYATNAVMHGAMATGIAWAVHSRRLTARAGAAIAAGRVKIVVASRT